jgi:hypothetical protein
MISVHSLVRFRALALSEPVVAAAASRGRGRPAAAGSAPPLDLFLLTTGVREDCGAYQKNRRKFDGTTRDILQSQWRSGARARSYYYFYYYYFLDFTLQADTRLLAPSLPS